MAFNTDQIVNLDFVAALQKRLKVGNSRLPHINAYPGRTINKVDLVSLNEVIKGFSEDFLKDLLSKKTLRINLVFKNNEKENDTNNLFSSNDEKIAIPNKREISKKSIFLKKFTNITNTYDTELLEEGTNSFAFGYPIIIKKQNSNPNKLFIAPIILWYLEINKILNQKDTWCIRRNEESPIMINEIFTNNLEIEEKISLNEIIKSTEEKLDDGIMTIEELREISTKILDILKIDNVTANEEVSKINFDTFESFATDKDTYLKTISNNQTEIVNNGVFGFYKAYKQNIINDYNTVLENFSQEDLNNHDDSTYITNTISPIESDPSQQEVIESLSKGSKLIIQGPPGTGKSQSLTSVIVNALANNSRCLIVCEKRTALDVLFKNLQNINLDKYVAVIENNISDRSKVVDLARSKEEEKYYYFNNDSLLSQLNVQFEKARENINKHHKYLNDEMFLDEYNWKGLVGKYLKVSDNLNWKEICAKLNSKELILNRQAYSKYIGLIIEARNINKRLAEKRLVTYINSNVTNFSNQYDAITKVVKDCEETIKILLKLKERINDFNRVYNDNLEKQYSTINTKISELTPKIHKFNEKYSKSYLYNKYNNFKDKFLRLFGTNSEYLKEKDSIKRSYTNIVSMLSDAEFEIENPINLDYLTNLEVDYEVFIKEYQKWNIQKNNRIFSLLQKYLTNPLNFKNLENPKKEIIDLIESFKESIESKDYTVNVKNNLDTNYSNQIHEIGILISTLELLIKNKEFLYPIFDWNVFIEQIDDFEKSLVETFILQSDENWLKIFESWYFSTLLDSKQSIDLLYSSTDIEKAALNLNEIKAEQIKYIKHYWDQEASKAINDFNYKNNIRFDQLYNKRGAAGQRRNSLRQIVHKDTKLFTSIFPVTMVNPSTCCTIFPAVKDLYDLIILDEASQLKLEDTFTCLLRGKHKVISGDIYQMPPSTYFSSKSSMVDEEDLEEDESLSVNNLDQEVLGNERYNLLISESLLDFAQNVNYHKVYLKIHYRSKHSDLIDFSNSAFYARRLIPISKSNELGSISYYNLSGIYDDQERVNESEANKVVEILVNDILNKYNVKMPSVGIATFNIAQRDLITSKIYERIQKDIALLEKFELLKSSGFFVKNLENIQGDEKDIIIISTTFGVKNDGKFLKNYGPITRKLGYRLLNVIITRAKEHIYLVTSIPESVINNYNSELEIENKNTGNAIFHAYLAYCKAISEHDESRKQSILDLIYAKCSEKETYTYNNDSSLIGTESPFEEEVVERLAKILDKDRLVLQYKYGGFRIDIVYLPKNSSKPILAIECDGASYHSSELAYAWDMYRQKFLESKGFIFHRIWSLNWFKEPEIELKNLIKKINEIYGNE